MDVFDEAALTAAPVGACGHAERAAYPSGAACEAHKDTLTAFVGSVYRWACDADQAADEQRHEAAQRIQQCWETDATMLDLRNLRLSTLPASLWMLNQPYPVAWTGAQGAGRTARHRAAPAADRAVAGTRLRQLLLDGNRLRVLPERIASLPSLRHLSIAHNRLTDLPDALKRLPALSYLNVGANDLAVLPDALGELTALEVLRADGCLLRWIPSSLGALPLLRELDLSDNVLTSLPDAIRWLPTACIVRLHDNALPERVRRALREGPAAPIWMLEDAPPVRSSRTLYEAAFAWLIAGADRCRRSLDAWRRIAHAHPEVAQRLKHLLDALGALPEASNSDTRLAFRTSIRDALKRIEADASRLIGCLLPSVGTWVVTGDALPADTPRHAIGDGTAMVDATADCCGIQDGAAQRDAATRAQWARLVAVLSGPRGDAGAAGGIERANAADAAHSGAQRDALVVAMSIRDATREHALRHWIDRYVQAHPLLDCADVLHACRIAIDHFDRNGTVLPLPRAASAQRGRPPASHAVTPALYMMSAEDLADCLQTISSIDVDGHHIARNRAERGNCIG